MENDMTNGWTPIDNLPPRNERPGRMFVVVSGLQEHSGATWRREGAGLAHTSGDGFCEADIHHIEAASDMIKGTGEVTHWRRYDLPPLP